MNNKDNCKKINCINYDPEYAYSCNETQHDIDPDNCYKFDSKKIQIDETFRELYDDIKNYVKSGNIDE